MHWMIVLTAAKEVVVTLAAVAGVWIAWRGLATWRDQLHGGSDYEIARTVLRAIYRLRDAIIEVRVPVFFVWELATRSGVDRTTQLTDDDQWKDVAYAYQQRWKEVVAGRRELQVALLEAEVLWGNELGGARTAVDRLVTELEHTLFTLYVPRMRDAQRHQPPSEEWLRVSRVVMAMGIDGDRFGTELTDAVARFEVPLRDRMRRHHTERRNTRLGTVKLTRDRA